MPFDLFSLVAVLLIDDVINEGGNDFVDLLLRDSQLVCFLEFLFDAIVHVITDEVYLFLDY